MIGDLSIFLSVNLSIYMWIDRYILHCVFSLALSISPFVYDFLFFYSFQRRIVGLHQNTSIGSTDITDMWEPLEDGLLPYETVDCLLLLNYAKYYEFMIIHYFSFAA